MTNNFSNDFLLSGGPKYLNIAKDINDKIKNGFYQAGEFIPTEEELVETYHVSRPTIRSAVAKLRELGLLEVEHGVGTRVSKRPIYQHLANQISFTEAIQSQGLKPGTIVDQACLVKSTPEIAGKFDIPIGEPVFKIGRLRTADDQPISYHLSYLRKEFPIEKEKLEEIYSLYRYLNDVYGIAIVFADDTISAQPAQPQIAKLLEIKPGNTTLLLERIAYDRENRVAELAYSYIRSDRFNYKIRINIKGNL